MWLTVIRTAFSLVISEAQDFACELLDPEGETLARQTGLVDGGGRPVRGLPAKVVRGAACDAEAAWRALSDSAGPDGAGPDDEVPDGAVVPAETGAS